MQPTHITNLQRYIRHAGFGKGQIIAENEEYYTIYFFEQNVNRDIPKASFAIQFEAN